MRTVVHLSDLHFGRIDEALIHPLIETIQQIKPDLLAVSGDLTQRARTTQFKAAQAFLELLPTPQLIVPGNHDIPAHNLLSRFFQPLDNYRNYITADLQPFYKDQEIAVMGINTARSLAVKGGRINEAQLARVREKFWQLPDSITKIVVTHHPFDLPTGYDEDDLVGRAKSAMEVFANVGVDLFLAGHLHISHTGYTAARYKIKGHSALVVQAGTATSTRGRGEANSFNVLRLQHPHIAIERREWQPKNVSFALASDEHFRHTPDGWIPA